MRLLLLSNSRNPGGDYLAHALDEIRDFLGPAPRRLAFVPYAAVRFSYDDYLARVAGPFGRLGHAVESLHEGDPHDILREADTIVVGGGNTFRLLEILQRSELLQRLRRRIRDGTPYIAWSAGANIACPTIRTTNDMPIVQPPSFDAMGLIPFQINPHYTEQVLPNHGGESRAERIAEFLAVNPRMPVVGLREGSWLRREAGSQLTLGGKAPMTLFRAGQEPEEYVPGSDLGFLLGPG
jgi:dipeptidase E